MKYLFLQHYRGKDQVFTSWTSRLIQQMVFQCVLYARTVLGTGARVQILSRGKQRVTSQCVLICLPPRQTVRAHPFHLVSGVARNLGHQQAKEQAVTQ